MRTFVYANFVANTRIEISDLTQEQAGLYELASRLFYDTKCDWLHFHEQVFAPGSPVYTRYPPSTDPSLGARDGLYRALTDMFLRLGTDQGHVGHRRI